jgi:hypothetical protein
VPKLHSITVKSRAVAAMVAAANEAGAGLTVRATRKGLKLDTITLSRLAEALTSTSHALTARGLDARTLEEAARAVAKAAGGKAGAAAAELAAAAQGAAATLAEEAPAAPSAPSSTSATPAKPAGSGAAGEAHTAASEVASTAAAAASTVAKAASAVTSDGQRSNGAGAGAAAASANGNGGKSAQAPGQATRTIVQSGPAKRTADVEATPEEGAPAVAAQPSVVVDYQAEARRTLEAALAAVADRASVTYERPESSPMRMTWTPLSAGTPGQRSHFDGLVERLYAQFQRPEAARLTYRSATAGVLIDLLS